MTYNDYFSRVNNLVKKNRIFESSQKVGDRSYVSYSYGSYFSFGCNFIQDKKKLGVELYISGGTNKKDTNKIIYNKIYKDKGDIELSLGRLFWQKLEEKEGCRIELVYDKDVSLDDSADKIDEYINWHVENLEKFKNVFTKKYGVNFTDLLSQEDVLLSISSTSKDIQNQQKLGTNMPKLSPPLNQILYGPPGTGKTYNTINKALEIIDDEFYQTHSETTKENRKILKERFDDLIKSGQIVFTTFHQSFGYEEFVEGIKAEAEDSLISYDIKAGIFKKLCELAKQKSHIKFELQGINFQNYIKVNQKFQTLTGIEFEITSVNEKIKVKNSQNKVHALSRKSILDYLEKQDFTNTRGHFSYQPVIAKYIFDQLEKKSLEDNTNKNYILIIDEINRGNISKIFGELITLIEPSKRIGEDEEIRVTLPYSGMGTDRKGFGVPSNLYIIGTMNTADRSIAQIDTALRRRFVFEEMMPDLTLLAKKDFKLEEEESLSYEENQNDLLIVNDKNSAIETINVRLMVKVINERIEYYYDREHMIGHSYFLPLIDIPTKEKLDEIFKINILPLLAEYFYGDWGDIQKILNNNFVDKKKKSSYIKDDSNQKNLYDINKEFTVAQYRKIYDNNEA